MGQMVEKISPGGSASRKTTSPASSKGGGGGGSVGVETGHGEAIRTAFLSGTLKLDPRCPLDERQLYGLTKSWKAINRNMSVTAINMFVRLFETNRDIQDLFSGFKDVQSVADLRNSKVLEGHAMKVFCTIDDTIVNFDDMDYVFRMLQIVAQSHSTRFANFNPDYFLRVEDPFILAVKEELGDRFTISIETTYRTTIKFIVGTLATEFTIARQASNAAAAAASAQATASSLQTHSPDGVDAAAASNGKPTATSESVK
jgi:neuroglobin